MKKIDDSYFVHDENKKIEGIESILTEDEEILWRGKPRKGSFILSAVVRMLPIVILWLLFDGTFIGVLAYNIGKMPVYFTVIMLVFFAVHLMPVWIWLSGIISAVARHKRTEYAFTSTRIILKSGAIGANLDSLYYSELTGVTLHVGIIEKMFKVGDVCISTTHGNYVLEDIDDPYFVTTQLQKIGNDMKTDMLYPNALRPENNSGYNTKYTSSAVNNLRNRRK